MRKKAFGDRYDGYRIKNNPTSSTIPFIVKDRCESQLFFDATIDLTKVNSLIKLKRSEGMKVGLLDYILTAIVRTISQYPQLNRFVAGKHIYARNSICIALVIKKALNFSAYRTFIKFDFKPESTIYDINATLHTMISKNRGNESENDMDKFIKRLNKLPRPIYSAVINTLSWLDYHGIMPKFVNNICPFHSSVIVTNMGSIGSNSIYHNICNWGTNSIFIAIGTKRKHDPTNSSEPARGKRVLNFRITIDTRISDKTYLSEAIDYFSNIFLNPESLELPPLKILEDN